MAGSARRPGLTAYPEARQLMHSLLRSMDGAAFAPTDELDPAVIRSIV